MAPAAGTGRGDRLYCLRWVSRGPGGADDAFVPLVVVAGIRGLLVRLGAGPLGVPATRVPSALFRTCAELGGIGGPWA
ncbi:hypothetical protein GCM10010145_11230 [Streptomyces ruber]|uniref:Uncharacterized protein n=2 Tax=Streptomyces TaxID=1883 RepID=A0A918B874_9ACTN|nr:hypothetical protein GCM10010145_11230 [Streptomyces ruber]